VLDVHGSPITDVPGCIAADIGAGGEAKDDSAVARGRDAALERLCAYIANQRQQCGGAERVSESATHTIFLSE
jgi:hypothetical protein